MKILKRIELASELYGYDYSDEKANEALEVLQEEIDDELDILKD